MLIFRFIEVLVVSCQYTWAVEIKWILANTFKEYIFPIWIDAVSFNPSAVKK